MASLNYGPGSLAPTRVCLDLNSLITAIWPASQRWEIALLLAIWEGRLTSKGHSVSSHDGVTSTVNSEVLYRLVHETVARCHDQHVGKLIMPVIRRYFAIKSLPIEKDARQRLVVTATI
jgi:hypothetical protein